MGKVKASEQTKKEIMEWLCTQITTILSDRQELERRWEKWVKQYEEELTPKSFPWENCANYFMPLTSTAVETVYARQINTIFGVSPIMTVKPKKSIFVIENEQEKDVSMEEAIKIEQFLQNVAVAEAKWKNKCPEWVLEGDKMGTSFIKPIWHLEEQHYRQKQNKEIIKKKRIISHSILEIINIEDILFPINAKDIQTCPIVLQRFYPHWIDLVKKQQLKIYENIEKIKEHWISNTAEEITGIDIRGTRERVEKLQRTAPDVLKEYKFYECWFDYEINGIIEKLLAVIETQTKTFLRFDYHPFNHERKPFIPFRYMKRTNRVYGIGICQMLESLQDHINTVTNQRVDNATIANVKCFKAKRTLKKELGKVFPSKIFYMDDPAHDLIEFSLGDIHQSFYQEEMIIKDWAERRTKVTEYVMGKESSLMRSRATATGTLALLQESGQSFALLIQDLREQMAELAYQTLELYQQFRSVGTYNFEYFALPDVDFREYFNIYCTATTLSINKDIERQSSVILLQQLSGIFEKILALMVPIVSQQMPEELRTYSIKIIQSYYTIARRLLQSFEVIDLANWLPELPDLMTSAYTMDTQKQMAGLSAGIIDTIKQVEERGKEGA